MSSKKSRRFFINSAITSAIATVGGLGLLTTGLSSCSTFDEYLFEDHFYLNDQVIIVGGGLSGLYLAYKLRQNKTEFRLLEGANRFGGRIRSAQSVDFGASLFSAQNKLMNSLVKELSLPTEVLDKNNYYLANGMESLVDRLVERLSGLMPYRSIRLEWQLISIQKINNLYELVFNTPHGHRTFVSKRVALAIPPSQWSSVAGLFDLPEMKPAKDWSAALKSENIIKCSFSLPPLAKGAVAIKPLLFLEDDIFSVRQINKRYKSNLWTEIDFKMKESNQSLEIEKLNDFIKKKMLLSGANLNKLTTENYFDWHETSLIEAAYFSNALPWPEQKISAHFKVLGDFATAQSVNTLEGSLQSAASAAAYYL